jgi:uncharacterized Tic20 family protein
MMKEDKTLLLLLHLSQLLCFVTGFIGIILPLVLWLMQRDKVIDMDAHGKAVMNFQMSLLIYTIVSGILTVVLIGFVGLAIVFFLGLIYPLINVVRVRNDQPPAYVLSLPLLK